MSVARFIADQKTFWRVPVAVCCARLGVSVSWFYKWWPRAQVGGPSTKRARRRAEVDAAVDAAYVLCGGKKTWKNDAERVAFLFELYQRITSLLPADKPKTRKKRTPTA